MDKKILLTLLSIFLFVGYFSAGMYYNMFLVCYNPFILLIVFVLIGMSLFLFLQSINISRQLEKEEFKKIFDKFLEPENDRKKRM